MLTKQQDPLQPTNFIFETSKFHTTTCTELAPMTRQTYLEKTLGEKAARDVAEAHVLLVGAGGVGCEMLKNLVLLGFGNITVVDLDTIDLSNLNRQFLFGHQHIKKAKAIVARETALKFNPNVNIDAHLANIMDKDFDIPWFQKFGIVFNALDNLDARRYVNRMCLTANVPLIESGTMGFVGQAQVIVPGKTECVDCTTKEAPKTYPICTIRSTPSLPVHTVVWAKSFLFPQLFGEGLADVSLDEESSKEDIDSGDLETLKRETMELKELREVIGDDSFAQKVFSKIFSTDIARQALHEIKNRRKPTPLDFALLSAQSSDLSGASLAKDKAHEAWNVEEAFAVFCDATRRLQKRANKGETLEFDKDDEDTLDFVAAAADLYSTVHGVDVKSKFALKQIAGDIIPAIATTNAIVAALGVQQGLYMLTNNADKAKCCYTSLRTNKKIFTSEFPSAPSVQCETSGSARVLLRANLDKLTLQGLVDFLEPKYSDELSLVTDKLIYDVDFDDNLDRSLADLQVAQGSFITCVDDGDAVDGKMLRNLEMYVQADSTLEEPFLSADIPEIPRYDVPRHEEDGEEEDEEILEATEVVPSSDGIKRQYSEISNVVLLDEEPSKIQKKDEDDDIVEIVEDVVEID